MGDQEIFQDMKLKKSKIPSLRRNVFANLAGRFWSALMSILVVPVFVHVLGTEAFGLIGLFASLQVVFAFLDLGLSVTVNREIAQNQAVERPGIENRILLRTFECIYWPIGLIVGSILLLGSEWIATNWVNIEHLTREEVMLAISIMALSFAARWPVSLYTGVLQGMQKQVLQNGLFIGATTLRTMGALAVIIWISPTITAFLLTQAIANMFEVSAITVWTWRELKRVDAGPAYFQVDVLLRVWRFALSFNAIGVLGMILSQADRLVISKYLPLEQLGFYAIASTAVGAMPLISNAVVTAVYPQFSGQVALGDTKTLAHCYHRAVQSIAFPAVGVSLAVAFFPYDILALWTRSTHVASQSSGTLSLLAAASLCTALHNPGYMLLVANGYTQIPLLMNGLNVFVFIPALMVVVPGWGIESAAAIWLTQNVIVLFVYSFSICRMVLKEKVWKVFMQDIFPYFIPGCIWVGVARLLTLSRVGAFSAYASLMAAAIGYCCTIVILARKTEIFPFGFVIWPAPDKTRS